MRDKIRYLLFKYWEESIQICFYAELFRQKNAFLLPSPLIFFWLKRASFATKESLFFSKVGKVTFFVRKSFPCRYFALSLHLETDERRGLSRSRLPKVPYLSMTLLWLGRVSKLPLLSKITLLPFGRDVTLRNVRSAFALPSLLQQTFSEYKALLWRIIRELV